MASNRKGGALRVDADGVRTFKTPAAGRVRWLLVSAVGLPIIATVLAVVALRMVPGGGAPARTSAPNAETERGTSDAARVHVTAKVVPAPPRSADAPRVAHVRPRAVSAAGSTPRPGSAAAGTRATSAADEDDEDEPELDARDVIPALIEAGERGGIAAFPPPGTDPVKPGVVVPETFELPEGYVRHYQTTDEGERLPAILMVHPDYELVNERGEPVTVPDRVVPPDLAPPGLPIEMLEVTEEKSAADRKP